MKNKIKFAYFFVIAYVRNFCVEVYNDRIENKKRKWKAYGTHGAGVVDLGKTNMKNATAQVAKFGTVVYCDPEQAAIFFSEKK